MSSPQSFLVAHAPGDPTQQPHNLPMAAVAMSQFLVDAADTLGGASQDGVPFPLSCSSVSATAFDRALAFCSGSVARTPDQRASWQRQFLADMETRALLDVILAADFLLINDLTAVATAVLHDRIHGKDVANLRTLFGVTNDLTPAREHDLVARYGWVDDPAETWEN